MDIVLYLIALAIISLYYFWNYRKLEAIKNERIRKTEKVRDELLEALVLTVEYVGTQVLRPLDGWSWFDVLHDHYPHILQQLIDGPPMRESNLVKHALYELELIGEEPETITGYLKVIHAFANMGHSGGSASVAIPTINALLQYKNLRPLTNDPDEWADVGDRMWQNKRNSEAFSEDGGKTYYLLSDRTRNEHGMVVDVYQKSVDMATELPPEL